MTGPDKSGNQASRRGCRRGRRPPTRRCRRSGTQRRWRDALDKRCVRKRCLTVDFRRSDLAARLTGFGRDVNHSATRRLQRCHGGRLRDCTSRRGSCVVLLSCEQQSARRNFPNDVVAVIGCVHRNVPFGPSRRANGCHALVFVANLVDEHDVNHAQLKLSEVLVGVEIFLHGLLDKSGGSLGRRHRGRRLGDRNTARLITATEEHDHDQRAHHVKHRPHAANGRAQRALPPRDCVPTATTWIVGRPTRTGRRPADMNLFRLNRLHALRQSPLFERVPEIGEDGPAASRILHHPPVAQPVEHFGAGSRPFRRPAPSLV